MEVPAWGVIGEAAAHSQMLPPHWVFMGRAGRVELCVSSHKDKSPPGKSHPHDLTAPQRPAPGPSHGMEVEAPCAPGTHPAGHGAWPSE